MFFHLCHICQKPISETEIKYWVGYNIVKNNKIEKEVIEIPFCSMEHSFEYHQQKNKLAIN